MKRLLRRKKLQVSYSCLNACAVNRNSYPTSRRDRDSFVANASGVFVFGLPLIHLVNGAFLSSKRWRGKQLLLGGGNIEERVFDRRGMSMRGQTCVDGLFPEDASAFFDGARL